MSDERTTADSELKELAGRWEQATADFNPRSGGELIEQRSLWGDAFRRFSRNRIAMTAVAIMIVFITLSIVVPTAAKVKAANKVQYAAKGQEPSLECTHPPGVEQNIICRHPFGTDDQGRDNWVRAWYGGRISLSIAFAVAGVILVVGLMYGSISGFFGGRLDNLMMRFLDSLYGVPYLPFAIIFGYVIRENFDDPNPLIYMVPALSITAWFTSARIIRGQVLSLRALEYVVSARSQGAKVSRIISRHIIPNTVGVLIIAVFLEVPTAILGEAALSFLGVGVQIPQSSWGAMANDGWKVHSQYEYLMLIPGLLIATTVLCAIAIADGLRDALDPRYIDE